jgi:protein-L-isoaspartate O-methyltransferase
MTTGHPGADYPLGNTDAEHERLIRQAARVAPMTERFFREAGIGLGQRVLDLGSGVGDVAMLVARLVGPSGEVVAIERDPKSIAKARARATEAGFHNVSFNESNVDEILDGKPFDAAVGRFILMYLPRSGCNVALNFTSGAAGRSVCFSRAMLGPGACAFGSAASLVRNGLSH